DSKAKLRSHALADRLSNFGRRTEKMSAARNIGEGLVDGNALDERGEIPDHLHGGVAQPLIFLEMPADKNQCRTKLARLPGWHAAVNTEGLGLVRSGKHDPSPDGNGFAAQ